MSPVNRCFVHVCRRCFDSRWSIKRSHLWRYDITEGWYIITLRLYTWGATVGCSFEDPFFKHCSVFNRVCATQQVSTPEFEWCLKWAFCCLNVVVRPSKWVHQRLFQPLYIDMLQITTWLGPEAYHPVLDNGNFHLFIRLNSNVILKNMV